MAGGILLLLALLYGLYYWSKKPVGTVVQIDESSLSASDKAKAEEIAARIYNDLHSGWLFGNNIWGNLGRDSQAYWDLAAFGNTQFAYAYNFYRDSYGTSMIAEIRDEGSLPSDSYKQVILAKASALNLV